MKNWVYNLDTSRTETGEKVGVRLATLATVPVAGGGRQCNWCLQCCQRWTVCFGGSGQHHSSPHPPPTRTAAHLIMARSHPQPHPAPGLGLTMEDTRIRQIRYIAKSVESLDILWGRYECSALLRSGMYGLVVARPSVTTLGTDNLVCRPSPASPPQPSRTNLPHSNSFRGHYLISSIQGENCLLKNYFYYFFLFILYFYIHNGKLKIRYIFAWF